MTRVIATTDSQADTPSNLAARPTDLKARITNLEDIVRGYTVGELVPGSSFKLKIDIPDGATADVDTAALPVALEVDDVTVIKQSLAAGANANTIQVKTTAGVVVSDAISINNFAVGQVARAANVAPAARAFAKGAAMRVTRTKAAGDAAARVIVECTLVAG